MRVQAPEIDPYHLTIEQRNERENMNATDKFQAQQYLKNDGLLANFMPASQRFTLLDLMEGEEGEFFVSKVLEVAKIVRDTPKTYETESIETKDKTLHLHYFKGGVDAWIVERDMGDTPEGDGFGEQRQAFGKITVVGGGWEEAEWGYISIQELIENGVELDLFWTPKTVKEMV